MKSKIKLISYLLLVMFCISIKASAEDKIVNINTSQKNIIKLIWIYGTHPPEYIFVIDNRLGFKNVDSLKKFVAGLPEGSVLEWDPGCMMMGGEPLLSSREEMENFKSFCEEHKIVFNLIPSG